MKNPIQALFERGHRRVDRLPAREPLPRHRRPRPSPRRTGASVPYLARRFAPPPEAFATLGYRRRRRGRAAGPDRGDGDRRPGAVLAALRRQRRDLARRSSRSAAHELRLTLPHGRARAGGGAMIKGIELTAPDRPRRPAAGAARRAGRAAVGQDRGERRRGPERLRAHVRDREELAAQQPVPARRRRGDPDPARAAQSPRSTARPSTLIDGVVTKADLTPGTGGAPATLTRQGQGPDRGDGRSSTSPACPIRPCRRWRGWR